MGALAAFLSHPPRQPPLPNPPTHPPTHTHAFCTPHLHFSNPGIFEPIFRPCRWLLFSSPPLASLLFNLPLLPCASHTSTTFVLRSPSAPLHVDIFPCCRLHADCPPPLGPGADGIQPLMTQCRAAAMAAAEVWTCVCGTQWSRTRGLGMASWFRRKCAGTGVWMVFCSLVWTNIPACLPPFMFIPSPCTEPGGMDPDPGRPDRNSAA